LWWVFDFLGFALSFLPDFAGVLAGKRFNPGGKNVVKMWWNCGFRMVVGWF
jgi:hypothetical protein